MTTPAQQLLQESCRMIQESYDDLGHELGWRFLTSPTATLSAETEIALITLNPGGDRDRPDHARESSEAGSAYLVEQWKGSPPGEANLQMQIRKLFGLIASTRKLAINGDQLLSESLTAQFIPFRSPSLDTLHRKKESFAFAARLWSSLFEHLSPKLVVTIDTGTFKGLLPVLAARWGAPSSREVFPTGWGIATAELVQWDTSDGGRAVMRLPHLSSFKLFSRAACKPHVERLVRGAVDSAWPSSKDKT